jgi:hypothetical protein
MTMTPKRRMPPGSFGRLESRTRKVEPSGKYGALTPLRAAACGLGNWIFACDCGRQVVLVARNVIRRAARGDYCRCSPKCTARRPQEATVAQ